MRVWTAGIPGVAVVDRKLVQGHSRGCEHEDEGTHFMSAPPQGNNILKLDFASIPVSLSGLSITVLSNRSPRTQNSPSRKAFVLTTSAIDPFFELLGSHLLLLVVDQKQKFRTSRVFGTAAGHGLSSSSLCTYILRFEGPSTCTTEQRHQDDEESENIIPIAAVIILDKINAHNSVVMVG